MRHLSYHDWAYCPNYTCCAYFPITSQKGFRQRCNHERLRLKWVEGKQVALEGYLARVPQDMCDDVAANYYFPPMNNYFGYASPANSHRSSLSNDSNSIDNWVHISGSIL